MNIFGNTDALIGSLDLLIMAIFILGSLIFRKSVANDMFDMDFSLIGSCAAGIIGYLILKGLFDSMKYPFLIGLILWIVAGFLLGPVIGDGNTE